MFITVNRSKLSFRCQCPPLCVDFAGKIFQQAVTVKCQPSPSASWVPFTTCRPTFRPVRRLRHGFVAMKHILHYENPSACLKITRGNFLRQSQRTAVEQLTSVEWSNEVSVVKHRLPFPLHNCQPQRIIIIIIIIIEFLSVTSYIRSSRRSAIRSIPMACRHSSSD